MRLPLDVPIALVTGANHPTGLGAGRALHIAGAHVLGLTSPSTEPPTRSRVWKELHTVDGGPEAWIDTLNRLAARAARPVFLLPTQDRLVEAFSLRRDELHPDVRMVLPPHAVVETLLDKTKFHDWARGHDLPVPDSYVVRSTSELDDALGRIRYPAILKPLYRTPEWDRYSPRDKVLKLATGESARQIAFPLFDAAPAYVLSQWIEGPDSAVHYCLAYCAEPGKIQVSATGRKLLQYPRQTGSTAVCVGTDNPQLSALTERVFEQVGFLGLGSLEVKYDAGGQPWITEPTVGRPNLQSHSLLAQGQNLHAVAMQHALGLPAGPAKAMARNALWVEERHLLELASSRHPDPVPWSMLFAQGIQHRRIGCAYSSWWDPAPGAALAYEILKRGVRKVRAVSRAGR